MAAMTAEVQKVLKRLSSTAGQYFQELHSKFKFDDDTIDAFEANNDALVEGKLSQFETFLTQEMEKKIFKQVPQPSNSKRKSSGGKMKPLAALGLKTSAIEVLTPTPEPKRTRVLEDSGIMIEDVSPEKSLPMASPLPRLVPVSLKASMNGELQKPVVADGARRPVKIQLLGDRSLWSGKRRGAYEWMDESLEDKAHFQDAQLANMEEAIVAASLATTKGDVEEGVVGVATQAEIVLCGRIACEGLEGKLNERSLLLEGSVASGGNSTRLNVAECPNFAAFPGQMVGVIGRTAGMSGAVFNARDFISGLPNPKRPEPRGEQPLHMITAAGPYCYRAGLDYSPLEKLIEYATQQRPDVLVLFGPFLDSSNARVAAGDVELPGENEPCSFKEFYTQHILPLLVRGLAPLRRGSNPTEVLLVPSLEEALSFHPLPQPPLHASLDLEPGALDPLRRLGVQLLPNPAHVQIGQLQVSLSSADALMPLVREILVRPDGRKIEESLRQLLRQRTLFPVLPREPAQVSEARASAFNFPERERLPDICVFPSQMSGHTGLCVDGTAFCNPFALCRQQGPGSFAELWVVPPVASAGAGEAAAAPFTDRVRIDVQKMD